VTLEHRGVEAIGESKGEVGVKKGEGGQVPVLIKKKAAKGEVLLMIEKVIPNLTLD